MQMWKELPPSREQPALALGSMEAVGGFAMGLKGAAHERRKASKENGISSLRTGDSC